MRHYGYGYGEKNRDNPLRDRVLPIASRIPAGHWMSYGDVARAIGSHALPVGQCMATEPMPNAHRILRADGSVSPGFRWVEYRPETPRELLESEGLRFFRGRADPARRWDPAGE